MTSQKSALERFLDKVNKTPTCWLWTGSANAGGYGNFMDRPGKNMTAHRWSLINLGKTPVPKGMVVCHTCNTPRCVNPAHLYAGTNSDNMKDRSRSGKCVGRTHWNVAKRPFVIWNPTKHLARQVFNYQFEAAEALGISHSYVNALLTHPEKKKTDRGWHAEYLPNMSQDTTENSGLFNIISNPIASDTVEIGYDIFEQADKDLQDLKRDCELLLERIELSLQAVHEVTSQEQETR